MDRNTIRIARKLVAVAKNLVAMSYKYVADTDKNANDGDVIRWGYEDEWHHPMNGFTGLIDFGKTSCRVRDAYFTLKGDMVDWEKGWLEQGTFYGNWENGTNEGGTFIGGTLHNCDWLGGDFTGGEAIGAIIFHGGNLTGGTITGATIDGANIKGAECTDCEFKQGKFLSGRWEGGKWLSKTEPEPPQGVEVTGTTSNPQNPYITSGGSQSGTSYDDGGSLYEEEETFNDPTPLPANTTRLSDFVDFHSELEKAIRNHRMVRFNYMKRSGEVEVIDFLPTELQMRKNGDEVCIGWKNGDEGNEEMKRTLHVQSMGDPSKKMDNVNARKLNVSDIDNPADIQQQLENAKNNGEVVSWLAETGNGSVFQVTGKPLEVRRQQQKKLVGYTEDVLMCKFEATNGQEITYGVKIHSGAVWKKPKGYKTKYYSIGTNPDGRYTVSFCIEMENEEGAEWRRNGYYVQCMNKSHLEFDALVHSIKRRIKNIPDMNANGSPATASLDEENENTLRIGYEYFDCLTKEQADAIGARLSREGFELRNQNGEL